MQINPDGKARIEIVAGSIPVLYVEDFYLDPDEVRAQALRSRFDQSIAMYPGRHSVITTPEARKVVQHVCDLLTAVGERTYIAESTITDFSILTTRAKDLLNVQKHPHIDDTPVLGLVYLSPHLSQGTCFYYNRLLETCTIVGPEQQQALQDFLASDSKNFEPETYDVSTSAAWEKIYTIEGRYNRLVVYPGNVFHSIDLVDVAATSSLEQVRLTQRIIVQHVSPKVQAGRPSAR